MQRQSLLDGLRGAVGDQVPDVAQLRLDDGALVLLLVRLFLFVLFRLLGVDRELLAHLLEDVEQRLRRRDAEVTDDDPPLELDRHVDLRAQVVGVQPVQKLGQGLLGQAGGDGVRRVLIGLFHRGRARFGQKLGERPRLVFVKAMRQRRQLDLGHGDNRAARPDGRQMSLIGFW